VKKNIAPQAVLVASARACRKEEAISTSSFTASASAATTFLRFGEGFEGFFRAAAGRSSAELASSTSASDLRLEPELVYVVSTGFMRRVVERPSRLLLSCHSPLVYRLSEARTLCRHQALHGIALGRLAGCTPYTPWLGWLHLRWLADPARACSTLNTATGSCYSIAQASGRAACRGYTQQPHAFIISLIDPLVQSTKKPLTRTAGTAASSPAGVAALTAAVCGPPSA